MAMRTPQSHHEHSTQLTRPALSGPNERAVGDDTHVPQTSSSSPTQSLPGSASFLSEDLATRNTETQSQALGLATYGSANLSIGGYQETVPPQYVLSDLPVIRMN
jgi:hypothetical protein